jgi:hypothetical protein
LSFIFLFSVSRLRPDAVPSQFPKLPSYHSANKLPRESRESKNEKIEQELLARAIKDSSETKRDYDRTRTFSSLNELVERSKLIDKKWTVIECESSVMIVFVTTQPAPKIKYSVVIDKNLDIRAYNGDLEQSKLDKFSFPCSINNINMLNDILDALCKLDSNVKNSICNIIDALQSLEKFDNVNKDMIKFLVEQISFLHGTKHAFRYSPETLIFTTLLHTIAPQAYRFIRKSNIINLPHHNTIQRLSASFDLNPRKEQIDCNFLYYIRNKFSLLEDCDKLIILMLDEIHLKEYVEYKGGNIVGICYNNNSCASSAHVFMIKSVLSKFKDVVHVLPVKTLTSEDLHKFIRKVIVGLEDIGFNVLCVITDNNSVNRKAMSYFVSPPKFQFVYPHPLDCKKPLFFLIDSVHLLKCIRNNWLNQKNPDKCFYYPDFQNGFNISTPHNFKTACLKSLKELHNLECNSLIKFGYKLTFKALFPSNLERQNVNLVLQLFNEFVAQALIELGEKYELQHFQDTADFITIILTWWHICNVKFISKGSRLNNIYQKPLTFDENDNSIIFLSKFLDWLDEWDKMSCTTGMFSKETHAALKVTVNGIIQISKYCKEELNIEYILPGKFQTDDLEGRFGFYRQLAGCQYNISLQQLFECEKKMRMQSALKLKLQTKAFGEVEIKDFLFEIGNFVSEREHTISSFDICVQASDIANAKPYLPVIIYLAGYCMFSVLKRESCSACKELHLLDKELDLNINYNFLKNIDRGRLMFPREHIVNAVLYNYIVINKLCFKHELEFLRKQNHRHIATATTITVLDDGNMLQTDDLCANSHSVDSILKKVVWVSTNILLNNFCKKKNEDVILAAQTKKLNKTSKRKLETLAPS